MELNETYSKIGTYIQSNPAQTYGQIAATLGLGRATVARIARLQGVKRRAGRRAAALEAAVAVIDAADQRPELGTASDGAEPAAEPAAETAAGRVEAAGGVAEDHAEATA